MSKINSIPYLKEERQRISGLTNSISISLFSLSVLVGLAYSFSDVTDTLHYKIWAVSPFLIFPYFLNKQGYINASRLILSVLLPVVVMYISITSKANVIEDNIINPVNYFDIRIVLINGLIIPFVLFSLKETRRLIVSLVPAYISLLLFDPIHDYFSVGYYQVGMISHDYYFSANLFTIITATFLSLIMMFLKSQILRSDYRQNKENSKIKLYLKELVKLSNSNNVNNGKVDSAKKEILQSAKACLDVSRISIWLFNHDNDSIKCEYLLENNTITSPETVLYAADYPSYFVELKYQQLIIAHDARTNKATSEFTDTYLKPLAIYSLMDAPFLSKGKLGGVICCEHQHDYKQWGAAESLLLKALGDFLSYTIIVEDRIKQNQLLTEKNFEITRVNENLESIVSKRTEELKEKNKQLTEYAYINSHILRAPVARISGLYHLFKLQTEQTIEDPAILDYMEESIAELENITNEINRAIEENGTIDRNQLMP
ncbi:GAF domain-containing protein [Fulvivirga lutea]|uniref:GAF domain-containing protein n=1 Tax=Fulvivirga lutea TaxID=2810512 RepID=A0A974WE73_9BACT|nr:GAF domain-containing protein [Fulvivirga lutea]QSE96674.1 GAF domain-containing protein [Fulvivirga lutea]